MISGYPSVALTSATHARLTDHLLQHARRGAYQEDLCFALWWPSNGSVRRSALVAQPVLPEAGERTLHGNASFEARYFMRAVDEAMASNAGLVFLHSHFWSGWQPMSPEDVEAEQRIAPRALAATGLPLLGMTAGTDGAWSARVWDRVGPRDYQRTWCESVRVVGDRLQVTFMDELSPPPRSQDNLRRTISAWGERTQQDLARLRVGVIGAGSVGSIVAEALARQGVQHVTLIDADHVKTHNLDRLLHATPNDVGRPKVELCAERLGAHATASRFEAEKVPYRGTQPRGYRAALDCDILFSCVDRPWPRQLLNYIAYAHMIPVVDTGVRVATTRNCALRGADWRVQTVLPHRRCLECLGQYKPRDVALERDGSLEDPSYIQGLPGTHFIHNNQNVFGFALMAAGLQVSHFISLVAGPYGVEPLGEQSYHLASGEVRAERAAECHAGCLYPTLTGYGDRAPIQPALESEA